MRNKQAFTLVEMLIVIVIIGILAASILPGLMGAKDKANDVARVANIGTINTAIVSYMNSTGEYPAICSGASALGTGYDGAISFNQQLDKIPKDPNSKNTFKFNNVDLVGEYGYCAIKKDGNPDSAYVIVARVADIGSANYISSGSNILGASSLSDTEYSEIKKGICDKITLTSESSAGKCEVKESEMSSLRYIILK